MLYATIITSFTTITLSPIYVGSRVCTARTRIGDSVSTKPVEDISAFVEKIIVESNRCSYNIILQADGTELERALMIITHCGTTRFPTSVAKFTGDEAAKILLNWH